MVVKLVFVMWLFWYDVIYEGYLWKYFIIIFLGNLKLLLWWYVWFNLNGIID